MRRALLFGLSAGLALSHPSQGVAALCIKWQAPATADARQDVRVAFRTTVPLVSGGYRPWATPDYPFRVILAAPDGTSRRLPMRPSERNPEVWTGSFTPDRAGRWRIRIANFEEGGPVDSPCYAPLSIRVLAGSAGGRRGR